MKIKTLALISTVALLSAASFAQDNQSRYDRAEANKDAHERGEGPGKPGPGHRGQGRRGNNSERVLSNLDTNEDGIVDEIEFLDSRLDRIENTFSRLDKDNDDLISPEEVEPRRPRSSEVDNEAIIQCVRETIADWEGPDGLDERFDNVDTDDDGFISMSELSIAQEERAYILFGRLDSDDDGNISLEELQASQKAQLELRRVVRHCAQELSDPFNDSVL